MHNSLSRGTMLSIVLVGIALVAHPALTVMYQVAATTNPQTQGAAPEQSSMSGELGALAFDVQQDAKLPYETGFDFIVGGPFQACAELPASSYANITRATIQLSEACLRADRINGSDNASNRLRTGTVILFRTNEGRLGKLEILEYGYNLRLRCAAYNGDGSLYRENNNLTVRGTFNADLDQCLEATASSDFFWQQATATERWLVPGSGATFWVMRSGSGSAQPGGALWGVADLHTHPASHLAWGANSQGKNLFWGNPGLSLNTSNVATDLPSCNHDEHAWGEIDPVRTITRKLMSKSLCGEYTGFTHGPGGFPRFEGWPNARSVIHQQMHISWIRRAYDGGLRLMVASATDNQLIAKMWNRGSFDGSVSPDPDYEYRSARTQLDFIRRQAAANADWMEIATSAADAHRIISANKLAVVLGLEMDSLNFDQINSLANEFGVRVVTPIHMANNTFGGAAVYADLFNSNNRFLTGNFYRVKGDPSLDFRLSRPSVVQYHGAGIWQRLLPLIAPLTPVAGPLLTPPATFAAFLPEAGIVTPGNISDDEYRDLGYDCSAGAPRFSGCVNRCEGQKNVLGLRAEQTVLLMQRGLLIDMAHMSEASQIGMLELAARFQYPVFNSHSGIRQRGGAERHIRHIEAGRMARLGGMLGMGTEGWYNAQPIYFRSGSPVVRFTGNYQRWTDNIGPETRIPNDAMVRQLVVSIRTGGDDLRGNNDNAIAFLVRGDGSRIDNLDLNRRASWGNGTLNTVTIDLPGGGVRRRDVARFGVRTTFGGGFNSDNWNMDDIVVTAVDGDGRREAWINRRSTPLKRFTGSDKEWIEGLPGDRSLPDAAEISRLVFTIRTGGDDLRGGNDNASALLLFTGCNNDPSRLTEPVRINLNRGARWADNTTNVITWDAPAGTRLRRDQLVGIRIETTLGGGTGGDNWNMDELTLRLTTNEGVEDLVTERGAPYFRFTGEAKNWERLFVRTKPLTPDTSLRCLKLTIGTGGDDLRGTNDNAFAIIELKDGARHEFSLNIQGGWGNGSAHSTFFCLPAAIRRDDLKSLAIRTTFSGGSGGDNWNVDVIKLEAAVDDSQDRRLKADPVAAWTVAANENLSLLENRGFALGTDMNGLAPQIPFSTQNLSYPLRYDSRVNIAGPQRVGEKTFDFIRDGLAHFGQLPEFFQLVSQQPNGRPVLDALFRSAGDFATMWERVEAAVPRVNVGAINNELVTLEFTIRTGGDDLRGGNDNAYGYLYLSDGGFFEFPLNKGARWADNTTNTVRFTLPYRKTETNVALFGIRTTFGGGSGGDNWNMDSLEIRFSTPTGRNGLLWQRERPGTPLVRFTGSNQNWWARL